MSALAATRDDPAQVENESGRPLVVRGRRL